MKNPLLCLKCKTRLVLDDNYMHCEQQHSWEVVNGIPRLIYSQNNYTNAFGLLTGRKIKQDFIKVDHFKFCY